MKSNADARIPSIIGRARVSFRETRLQGSALAAVPPIPLHSMVYIRQLIVKRVDRQAVADPNPFSGRDEELGCCLAQALQPGAGPLFHVNLIYVRLPEGAVLVVGLGVYCVDAGIQGAENEVVRGCVQGFY